MHLLSAHAAAQQQEGEAMDLDQSPAPLIFASAADSELAAFAAAVDRAACTDVRLANIMSLAHNMSVDMWLQKTLHGARVVVVRLLGGRPYWPYGTDELVRLAKGNAMKLVLLPGDASVDPDLLAASSISPALWHHLHALFVAGGPDNMDRVLFRMRQMLEQEPEEGGDVSPFPRFGCRSSRTGVVPLADFEPVCPSRGSPPEGSNPKSPPHVPLLFYRSVLEGAGTATLDALIASLEQAGMCPVPLVISTLKEGACARFVRAALERFPPEVILNLTGFALDIGAIDDAHNPFSGCDAPVIQLVQAGCTEKAWQADPQGLSPRDLAMQVVLPELDGRIGGLLAGHKRKGLWHAATQCALSTYAPDPDGIDNITRTVANWVRLRCTTPERRRLVLVLANYPIRDGRIANGVGYDAPLSTFRILEALDRAGYRVKDMPGDGNELIRRLQHGPTNAYPGRGTGGAVLKLHDYKRLFATLPLPVQEQVSDRWGTPERDPFCRADGFHLPVLDLGHVAVLLQPARGYDRDMEASYHDPDLVPPHAYLAAYLWARFEFGAHALIHNGKHGNLEWLPGKATALSASCYPNALWGGLPHFYPFIVNDPGEGTQAKRRTGAVIIDHLVPPLTRAETYGPLKDLESLLDEYYTASGMDPGRLASLRRRILDFSRDTAIDRDIGLADRPEQDDEQALARIDNFLCELKEAQIRDGLHVFGTSPTGEQERDLLVALTRVPRGEGAGDASLIRALCDDLKLDFDPLDASLAEPWTGPRPPVLQHLSDHPWRSHGDTIERLEMLALELVSDCSGPNEEGGTSAPGACDANSLPSLPDLPATAPVLAEIRTRIRPALRACGPNEMAALLDALAGRFTPPGPSGAPSRGRLDVLPTGRNFYSLDNRAVPTPTAWELGRKSAENLVARHFQDHGTWLRSVAMSAWGTANMRTGGDDIAQALALIGVRPRWDPGSLRVSGHEIIPLAALGRPRVDVTLRISGFFRDAFPGMIALFDRAVRAVGALDEPEDQNPIAANMRTEALGLMQKGVEQEQAALGAGFRIFGSRPGSYGAGLQGLMDSGQWQGTGDLARAFLNWGQYAYGAGMGGKPYRARFAARLKQVEAVVHNQDNREHDLLDSDDYYQFEGGLNATVHHLSGQRPAAYHQDHSRPERPRTRTLEEEISHVMRARVVNPKWLQGVMRHGYKGAFEIVATLDYMFAFAATTGAVRTHHFDLAFDAFVRDDEVRTFLQRNNPQGYDELLNRFDEAIRRRLWTPRSNSVYSFFNGDTPDD